MVRGRSNSINNDCENLLPCEVVKTVDLAGKLTFDSNAIFGAPGHLELTDDWKLAKRSYIQIHIHIRRNRKLVYLSDQLIAHSFLQVFMLPEQL